MSLSSLLAQNRNKARTERKRGGEAEDSTAQEKLVKSCDSCVGVGGEREIRNDR